MAEEGKSQTYLETHKTVAAGIASVIEAIFTSRLGVPGTLIGTALAAVVITLGFAMFKAQLMQASHRPAGLPKTVRGRLSRQQIRILGKANAESNPEPATPDKALTCSRACTPCRASSESYHSPRGVGYSSLTCSPGW